VHKQLHSKKCALHVVQLYVLWSITGLGLYRLSHMTSLQPGHVFVPQPATCQSPQLATLVSLTPVWPVHALSWSTTAQPYSKLKAPLHLILKVQYHSQLQLSQHHHYTGKVTDCNVLNVKPSHQRQVYWLHIIRYSSYSVCVIQQEERTLSEATHHCWKWQ